MTRDVFIERLESYLEEYEGVTPLPDAVRARVRAALPSIKQGGPSGPLRFEPMATQLPAAARYGLLAAAVVAAIAIGVGLVLRGNVGDDDPTPTPSATAVASATASTGGPASLLDSPQAGDLPAGEYSLDHEAYPARIEFTVPEGWWYYWTSASRAASDVHAILVNSGVGDGHNSAWGFSFAVVEQVRTDPCDAGAGYMDASVAASAASLAAAFETWTAFAPTTEDVTIGGFPGKRVKLVAPVGSDCIGGLFTTPTGYRFDMPLAADEPFENPHQFTFLDVDGSVLVIWTTDHPGSTGFEVASGASPDPEAHVADQVEMDGILDSIVLTPR